jgi:hypothetical protein
VLVIIGLMLTLMIASGRVMIESKQRSAVKEKLEVIRNAMVNHIARTRRLPCPAAPASANGLETTWTAGVGVGNCAGLTAFANTYAGVVPWTTLGLGADVANDPWSRRISYAVSRTALMPDGYRRTGTITVHSNAPANAANQMNVGNNAIAMLVSHGKNGYEAWLAGGGTSPVAPGLRERENRPSNVMFVSTAIDDTNPGNPFDDHLLWFSATDIAPQLTSQVGEGSAEAVTRMRLARLRDAIIGAIVSQTGVGGLAQFPTPVPVAGLVLNPFAACGVRTANSATNTAALAMPTLPAELQNDGWGQPFLYSYRLSSNNAFTQNTPPNTAQVCPAIQLRSRGPDEQSGTAANQADDLIETILETDISARLP